jgi:hypothetical protein
MAVNVNALNQKNIKIISPAQTSNKTPFSSC